MRTVVKLGAVVALAIVGAGAALAPGWRQVTAQATGTNHIVTMPGDRFVPFALTIDVGDSVTWQNTDADAHTVVTVPGEAPAPLNLSVPAGASATFTFTVPGVYHDYCNLHAEVDAATSQVASLPTVDDPSEPMEGVILVQGTLPGAPASSTVGIPGDRFSPFLTIVKTGGTVIWDNADSDAHSVDTVPGNAPLLLNLPLAAGTRKSFTFSTPGLYWYFCSLHGEWDAANGQVSALPATDAPNEPMMGVVAVVTDSPAAAPTSAPPPAAATSDSTFPWLPIILAAAGTAVLGVSVGWVVRRLLAAQED